MFHALSLTVERHEATFGQIDLDGQKKDADRRALDDSQSRASYANFCRVTGTPEEVIIDLGLNLQPIGVPTDPIPVAWRVVTNFATAKRLALDMQSAIRQHEATHGTLETDVQKRVKQP